MFQKLGHLTARGWPFLIGGWTLLLAVLVLSAPPWDAVAESGQFAFLPPDAPSNRGKDLFKAAFPNEPLGSNVVIVLARESEDIRDEDRTFIDRALKPGLAQIADEQGQPSVVARVRAPTDQGTGALLVSGDKRAALVAVELTTEALGHSAWPTI